MIKLKLNKNEKVKEKPKLFGFGFSGIETRAKKSKHLASCFNCKYYYQKKGDREELCQNVNVTEYDMVKTPTNIYCSYWEIYKEDKKECLQKKGLLSIIATSRKKK